MTEATLKQPICDTEDKKMYLREYEKTVRELQRAELRIKEIRLNKMCPSVIQDGMPHTSGCSDLSAYAALLDQEERKYIRARYQRVKKCREIMDRINRIENDDEKDVLIYRYIRLMKWEEICVKMKVSWKQVHRFHSKALNNFKMT